MTNKLKTNLLGLDLQNPVIAASGTFGFGREYSNYIDLNLIGGISVKGLTLKPRKGNEAPRIAETPAGILNSVGLQNPGVEAFIKDEIPFLRKFSTKIIVNIAGNTVDEYAEMARILDSADVDAIEVNVSCPNVKEGCVAFGVYQKGVQMITKAVKNETKKPVIVKLTPNVTNISELAKAAESEGADAVSLINTLLGFAIDINTRRPILANNFGGLSGPAVKPVALRMVHEVYKSVKIPVIGMGGISTWQDAIEFFLAGASSVMVGTANFVNPATMKDIVEGINDYLTQRKIDNISNIIGEVQLYE